VYTPTLTGLRAHLLTGSVDLTTHIQDLVRLLFYEDLAEVVLVGHSYAGAVISGVAARTPERLASLIYLDAYLPLEGQSLFDVLSTEERESGQAALATGTGLRPPVPPAALGITDPTMAAWVAARLTPHPLSTYAQPIPIGPPASAALPRAFIYCTAGLTARRFAPFAQQARAAGWAVRELATGHDAMLTAPQPLVELLLELGGLA
jgi:pimeloyl-ACP methyl ester carboxylesterase